MRSSIYMLVILMLACTFAYGQTQLTSGKVSAKFTPEAGLTELKFDGRTVMIGSSAHFAGSQFTLMRNVPTRDWNWPANRTTPHYAVKNGKLINKIGHWKDRTTHVLQSQDNRYTVEHRFAMGINVTFDHVLAANDLTMTITIDNQTPDPYQLDDWLLFLVKPQGAAKLTHRMGNYYPAGDNYSPVSTISDRNWGMGISYIKHDLRPMMIRLNARPQYRDYQFDCWLKDSPIPAGSRSSYTIVLRLDQTPGDWKNLLEPYRQWFSQYYGPAQYHTDFRLKVGVFACYLEGVTPTNPRGYFHQLDRTGWLPYLRKQVGHLSKYNTGEVIIWGATGISQRGVNYRPDFDVMPPILEQGLDQLAPFFQSIGNKRFGFFARPNTIAYQETWAQDADVSFNPHDPKHVRMADKRYERLADKGATAFYMDTYGADWGAYPGAAKGSAFYLKHLRDKFGPDALLVSEFGFDVFSVYAMVWPNASDKLGQKPIGAFAQWLVPGSVEFCRAYHVDGVKRAWQMGAVPMINDFSVNTALMQMQNQYVNPDGSSKVRSDCQSPKVQAVSSPLGLPQQKTGPADQTTSPVDSLFRKD
ncbi:MAG: hypothetical protein CMJ19_00600 [Phycisphaeraceae bacterium]|nr:hypothetical protein [Phycisphaeraceae bacterium]